VADITAADWWGIKKLRPDIPAGNGVSLLLVNTPKGEAMVRDLESMRLWDTNLMDAVLHQRMLHDPSVRRKARDSFYKDISRIGHEAWEQKFLEPRGYIMRRIKFEIKRRIPSNAKNFIKGLIRTI
jgi:hypothetical protein